MSSFSSVFGSEPAVTARTPGRVNLIGEHIDYTGGLVLPTPINRFIRIEMKPMDGPVVVYSQRFGDPVERQIDEPVSGHWSDYVLAAHRKAVGEGLLSSGARYLVESDLPHGAGLSSSAALSIGVLRAAADAGGTAVDPVSLALWAQEVERDDIGMPCGIMDQMAIAVGRPGHALALETDTLQHRHVPLFGGHRFLVFHSGLTRGLSDGQYKDRYDAAERVRSALGAEYLSHAQGARLDALASISDTERKTAGHAIGEHQRAMQAEEMLRAQDPAAFGQLMNESHTSMRDALGIVPPRMDAMCVTAREAGALGARLTGGGFGGCVVVLASDDQAEAMAQKLKAAFPDSEFIASAGR